MIGMACFMSFITCMGVYMFMQPDDYDQKYYEKGLAFDKEYDKEQRAVNEHMQPTVSIVEKDLKILFHDNAKGQLHFIRPSDRHLDKTLIFNNSQVAVPINQLAKGQWQLVFEWGSNGKQYLYKQEMFIP